MSVLEVVLAVITNKYVIIAVVAVIFYLSFINYIISYKKRPKRVKQKKAEISAPAPKKEVAEPEVEEIDDDEEYV